MKKMKDLTKVKTKLIELGYIDNEWFDKYIEIIEANLETKRNRTSTQAHHAIPVNDYWLSDEPYNRLEALKLANADEANFEVNLLYKDHLLAHSYLTLCTDLDNAQQKYEMQADLRKKNSSIAGSSVKNKEARILATIKSNKARKGSEYIKRHADGTSKTILCVELGLTFNTIREASRQLDINESNIAKCLRGITKTSGKFHWKYL